MSSLIVTHIDGKCKALKGDLCSPFLSPLAFFLFSPPSFSPTSLHSHMATRRHGSSSLSLRSRNIPIEVPALPPRRVKQKRPREQTPPTQQTDPDLTSLDGEEEEHPCEASSSSVSLSTPSVQLQSAPSIVRSEAVNAPCQQGSDTPFQEQHQEPLSVQRSQRFLDQRRSITTNSGRQPLAVVSPKVAAARSLQPNAPAYSASLNQRTDKKKAVPSSKRMRSIAWSDIQRALIQWMTTGDNLTRVSSKGHAGPLGIGKVYEEAAEHVREKTSRMDFNGESARHAIDNIVKRVRGANTITSSTGSGTYGGRTIDEQREALCPGYKDLWPIVQGIPNTKFVNRQKSSLPPVPPCPAPSVPLPGPSLFLPCPSPTPQPPSPRTVAAVGVDIELEGITVPICPNIYVHMCTEWILTGLQMTRIIMMIPTTGFILTLLATQDAAPLLTPQKRPPGQQTT